MPNKVTIDTAAMTLAQMGRFIDALQAGDQPAAAAARAVLPDEGWTLDQIEALTPADITVLDDVDDNPDAILINRNAMTLAQDKMARDIATRKRVHMLVAYVYVHHAGRYSLAECKGLPFTDYNFDDHQTGRLDAPDDDQDGGLDPDSPTTAR